MHSSLLSLLQLADPMLPIGGYAHSSGLETYVQQGVVHNLQTATLFITAMLERNVHYTDAALVSLAYAAAQQNNFVEVLALDAECHAVKLAKEIREASRKLGMRLLKLFHPVSQGTMAAMYKSAVDAGEAAGHYCIAYGAMAYALQVSKQDALTGFYYNAAAGMVTNSVKLVPLGQQDGQELLFALQPLLVRLVAASMQPDISLVGLSCAGFDIRCMQHEQLYSRLYMS